VSLAKYDPRSLISGYETDKLENEPVKRMVELATLNKQNDIVFICSRYSNMEFLLSRDQFAESAELTNEKAIKSPIKYLASVTRHQGRILPLFDFDFYLRSVFGAKQEDMRAILLIASIQKMSRLARETFQNLNIKQGNDHEKLDYIGIKMTAASETVPLEKHEMRILPPLSQEVQHKRGIVGLRFPDNGKIQYILDIETIIINNIANRPIAKKTA
jgi:hypothetical protein